MPISIVLLQKCARYGVPGEVIKNLHYTDLLLLLMGLDIAERRSAVRSTERLAGETRLSGKEAAKYLKRI